MFLNSSTTALLHVPKVQSHIFETTVVVLKRYGFGTASNDNGAEDVAVNPVVTHMQIKKEDYHNKPLFHSKKGSYYHSK